MSIDRRTFLRLAAAGLSSAAVGLHGCVEDFSTIEARHWPTPEEPFTPTAAWYYVALQGSYEADERNYRLRVVGQVRQPLTFRVTSFPGPFEEIVTPITLACVGNEPNRGLLSASYFRGVRTRDVLQAAGLESRASAVVITGLDGYLMERSLSDLMRPETILAYAMGTSPESTERLPIDHGFPVRILTPGTYGWIQPKWISAINVIDEGYHHEVFRNSSETVAGRMQLASGFSWPRSGFAIGGGEQRVLGWAFGDTRPITRIELQVDGGPWEPARIVWNEADDELPSSVWCLWEYLWDAPAGDHELSVRAFYADGQGQQEGRSWPYSGGTRARTRLRVV